MHFTILHIYSIILFKDLSKCFLFPKEVLLGQFIIVIIYVHRYFDNNHLSRLAKKKVLICIYAFSKKFKFKFLFLFYLFISLFFCTLEWMMCIEWKNVLVENIKIVKIILSKFKSNALWNVKNIFNVHVSFKIMSENILKCFHIFKFEADVFIFSSSNFFNTF